MTISRSAARRLPAPGSERHVLLVMDAHKPFVETVMTGIKRWVSGHPLWRVRLAGTSRDLHRVKGWPVDGAIATDLRLLAKVRDRLRIHAVSINPSEVGVADAQVTCNDEQIGRLAGAHLVDRRFRSFGFVGYGDQLWSRQRRDAFIDVVGARGPCETFDEVSYVHRHTSRVWRQALRDWLTALPERTAIACGHDWLATVVLETAERARLPVPERLAVIGVDNVGFVGEFANPPLSTVVNPLEQIGYESCAVLQRLLDRSTPPPPRVTFVQSPGVLTRRSTDVMAIDDDLVASTLAFIRAHLHLPISVPDLCANAEASRSVLEQRMRHALGDTPLGAIRRARIERACELLSLTRLNVPEVAERCGFNYSTRLAWTFRRYTGQTPTQWRRGKSV